MTAIRFDPGGMRGAASRLNAQAHDVDVIVAALRPNDVAGLPPAVAAHVSVELGATSGALTGASRLLQDEALNLGLRAALAEIADGAGTEWRASVDRSGAWSLLEGLKRVRGGLKTAAKWYLNPTYVTRHGLAHAWQRTLGQSLSRRISAIRSYPGHAGQGLKGASARWYGVGRKGSALTRTAKVIAGSGKSRIPIVGDALTWKSTFDTERKGGASVAQAHGAAAGATAGSRGGMMAGATSGAMIGTMVGGPVGGLVGGVAGAIVGSDVGKKVGGWLGKKLFGR